MNLQYYIKHYTSMTWNEYICSSVSKQLRIERKFKKERKELEELEQEKQFLEFKNRDINKLNEILPKLSCDQVNVLLTTAKVFNIQNKETIKN